ncbi:MAG TPA: hypothetical protein VGR62_11875 [Candidatus Binatia bacterium]|jgi:hypothetical protein|nr:hypothetical protein [Candidatus Binatia bacterium]
MSSIEDEESKKRIQEAVWDGTQKLIVLLVVFGGGFFAAWLAYGYGPNGAPALRDKVTAQESSYVDVNKKRVDAEGKATVVEGQLQRCQADLQKLRNAAAAAPAPPPAP